MIPLHKYEWLLFDLDNTLMDFHEPSVSSFRDLCSVVGLPYSEDMYGQYKLVNNRVWGQYEAREVTSLELRSLRFQRFFDQQSVTFDPMEAHDLYIDGLIKYSKPSSATVSVLERLRQTHELAIITNGLREAQRPRLHNTGLHEYFSHTIVSDEIGLAKPQPEYFDYVMNSIEHFNAGELLIIGDSLMSDIKGGVDSDIDTVWYNPTKGAPHSSVSPTYEIHSLSQLIV